MSGGAARALAGRALCLMAAGLALPLVVLLAGPLLALGLRISPDAFVERLAQRETQQAIWLSLGTSAASTALVVLLGTPLAYGIARGRSPLFRALDVLVELPTVFPPAVAGVALLLFFGRKGLLGSWLHAAEIEIAFTATAVVLAQMFVSAPFFIKTAAAGFAEISSELLDAASLDGAGRFEQFRRIVLPLAWRSLATGAALCWARSVGEFGATIVFAGNIPGRTQTMSLAIYLGFEIDLDQALALSAILLAISLCVLSAIRLVLPRHA